MFYLFLALFLGLVFALCYAVDLLLKRLFPKTPLQQTGKAVRMPRISSILGIGLTFAAFAAILFFWAEFTWVVRIACLLTLGVGIFLLVQFFSFAVYYDEEGFEYRALGHKAKTYAYSEIRGQKSILSRSGVVSSLYVGDDELQLTSSMQGLNEFLQYAFRRWCEETDTDPDTVENNPQYLTYFPSLK